MSIKIELIKREKRKDETLFLGNPRDTGTGDTNEKRSWGHYTHKRNIELYMVTPIVLRDFVQIKKRKKK